MTKKRFSKAISKLDLRKKNKEQAVPGILGFKLNGQQIVEVPTRDGFVYVRLRNNTSEVIQAFNEEVAPVYGLPVLVTRDEINKSQYMIAGRDLGIYMGSGGNGWGTSPYLPRHGATHSFNPISPGGDLTWIYSKQFMPLLVYPSGSNGGPNVLIDPSTYYKDNFWHHAGGTGTSDLIPTYTPTGGNDARMVLVYLDDDGNPQLEPGSTYFAESITGASAIVPYLPALPDTGALPLGGVRLVSGTSAIVWANLYDLRPLIVSDGFIPTGSNAPYNAEYVVISNSPDLTDERAITAGVGIELTDGGAGSTLIISVTGSVGGANELPIYDDHIFKVTGTAIDFVEDIQVEVTGSFAYVSISTGTFARAGHVHPSDNWYLTIYEDGVFKATGTVLDFQDNLNIVVSGSSIFIDAITGGGGGGDLLIYDDSVFKVTGSAISFDDNLSVEVTGSVAYITGVGATGSVGPPGDNTLLIYDDHVFKITGTAIDFTDALAVDVTGSVAYVKSTGSAGGGYTEGARVYHNTAVTIPNGTWTALPFVLERWDTDGIHDTATGSCSRLTCKTAGKYLIVGNFFWEADVNTSFRYARIYLNGTTRIAQNSASPLHATNSAIGIVTTIYNLDVDDYVELHMLQDSGGDLDVTVNAEASPEFMIQRMG